jgi:hypothetical protein
MGVDSRSDLLPILEMNFVATALEPNELRSLDCSCQQFAVLNGAAKTIFAA